MLIHLFLFISSQKRVVMKSKNRGINIIIIGFGNEFNSVYFVLLSNESLQGKQHSCERGSRRMNCAS